jgi:hypothetical protein
MPANSQTEHLTEIAAILGAGLLRLRGRKSSSNSTIQIESSLDCGGFVVGDEDHQVESPRR